MEKKKQYLRTGEAADYIGISHQTLRNYHQQGLLIPERILDSGHRYYSLKQLDRFIAENLIIG